MLQGRFSRDLHVVTAAGKKIRVKQLSVCESHKLLGCHKEPMGLQNDQLEILKTKCDEFTKVVNCSTLDRHESLIFYRHIYIPSATCPLCTTFFAEKQLDSIQSQANHTLTQSCGYAATLVWPFCTARWSTKEVNT